jgi:hypothetical protein
LYVYIFSAKKCSPQPTQKTTKTTGEQFEHYTSTCDAHLEQGRQPYAKLAGKDQHNGILAGGSQQGFLT